MANDHIKIFWDGARWIAQEVVKIHSSDPSFPLPAELRTLASAENLGRLHDALRAVVPYPQDALRVLEQMMRRR